jgi:putative hydroxymethylpyrimidine transport system substrate-binding protein
MNRRSRRPRRTPRRLQRSRHRPRHTSRSPRRTPRRLQRTLLALALGALAALVALGCGSASVGTGPSSSSSIKTASVTLVLDFVPNAVHAGIYRALAAGSYRQQHIDLTIVQPGATSDPLSLVAAGKAQFGLADGSDVAAEIAAGGDARAVMAIAQRPLGGLIALASSRLRSPAQLQGRAVGITGVPSDLAVLRTEVGHAGGDPARVHVVNVGFNGAQALLAGRLAAFTGFIPADGVQLQVAGHPITAFAFDENGGPGYPGLVAFTTRALIASDPGLVRRFVAATVHGYEDTIRDPARSLEDLLRLNPSLERRFTAASLAVYVPLFSEGGRVPFGTLRAVRIEALSAWMVRNRLIAAPLTPARYGTDAFLPGR